MKDYLRLSEAAGILPVPVAPCTIWRWCVNGYFVPATKRVVRLEHVNIGRRLFTTKKWVEEFIAELTAAKACHPEGIPKTATKKQRLRELQEADEILRREGI